MGFFSNLASEFLSAIGDALLLSGADGTYSTSRSS